MHLLGLLLYAAGYNEQIQLLQLGYAGIQVAQYYTELPDKELKRLLKASGCPYSVCNIPLTRIGMLVNRTFRAQSIYATTVIWQERMVSSAASCFAGVTPAQHEAITLIGVSGMNAFRMRAFETTQMSVQRPMRHISRSSPP